jgi:cell division protein FtsW (lipid II flippase)
MSTDQSELKSVMRENDERHVQLRGAYSDLMQRRDNAEALMADGSVNVVKNSIQTESAHTRQRIWYIIAGLTLLLFSKFAFQSGKSATNLTSTMSLMVIVVLFTAVTASGTVYSSPWISILLPVIVSLIVILYISHYIVHRG